MALAVIAVGSTAWAVYLVWRLAARDGIGGVSSPHLMAILALVLLPGATFVAWRLERRHRVQLPNRPDSRGKPPG